MDYFSYARVTQSQEFLMEVYNVVSSLEGYAKAIYKGLYEEVLDKAFFHILDNFDPTKGQLENYATSVVGKILLNKYRKEVTHDLALDIALEEESVEKVNGELLSQFLSASEEKERSDVSSCIDMLVPYFIKDARFFVSLKSVNRTLSYSDVFEKYSTKTVKQAVDYLRDKYLKELENVYRYAKSISVKRYVKDRYKKSMEDTIVFRGEIGGIIIYEKIRGFHDKLFYSLDLKGNIARFMTKYYYSEIEGVHNYIKVRGVEAFVSILGELIVGLPEIYDTLEAEMVGMLVSRFSSIKVIKYEKQNRILFSSANDLGSAIPIKAFGDVFYAEVIKLGAKQV